MGYIEPVTDRTQADVITGKEKGFFNDTDWNRIINNTVHANGLVSGIHRSAIPTDPIPTATELTIPEAEAVNALVRNIRRIRTAAVLADWTGFPELKEDYSDGGLTPNYAAVNDWERAIDLIVRRYETLVLARFAQVGIAGCGRGLNRNNRFRG